MGACAASALLSTDVWAQAQTVTGATVDLTVSNAFSLTETTSMQYGTLAVFCDTGANNTTTMTLSNAGALSIGAASGGAQAIDIDATSPAARSQGVFDITGAAPSTTLTVVTNNPANLTCGPCGGGNPVITFTSVTNDSGGTVTTDNAGVAQINVGAVLTTLGTCGGTGYADGLYQGTYDVSVTY